MRYETQQGRKSDGQTTVGLCTQIVLKDKVCKYFTTYFKNMNLNIDSKMVKDLKKISIYYQETKTPKKNKL